MLFAVLTFHTDSSSQESIVSIISTATPVVILDIEYTVWTNRPNFIHLQNYIPKVWIWKANQICLHCEQSLREKLRWGKYMTKLFFFHIKILVEIYIMNAWKSQRRRSNQMGSHQSGHSRELVYSCGDTAVTSVWRRHLSFCSQLFCLKADWCITVKVKASP